MDATNCYMYPYAIKYIYILQFCQLSHANNLISYLFLLQKCQICVLCKPEALQRQVTFDPCNEMKPTRRSCRDGKDWKEEMKRMVLNDWKAYKWCFSLSSVMVMISKQLRNYLWISLRMYCLCTMSELFSVTLLRLGKGSTCWWQRSPSMPSTMWLTTNSMNR